MERKQKPFPRKVATKKATTQPRTTRSRATSVKSKPGRTAKAAAKTAHAAAKAAPKKVAPKKVAAKKVAAKKVTPKKVAAKKAASAKAPAKSKRATRAPAAKTPRRAIFIDVENTSNEAELISVIEELKIDRAARPTEVMAVGNWRSVGQGAARTLAKLGAQLVHSAPTTGVRDWSDLWIAVTAGRWLGTASPGDVLEIVSDDRAFDAVGDAAAMAGVEFARVVCRRRAEAAHPAEADAAQRKSRRGGRRRRHPRESTLLPHPTPSHQPAPARPHPVAAAQPNPVATTSVASEVEDYEEAHGASAEQVRSAIARLCGNDPSRSINLDALANALKAEGFVRPPGSARLVTRLRKMKDVQVHPNGTVRLNPEESKTAEAAPEPSENDTEADDAATATAGESSATRRRRRGGRKRRRRPPAGGATPQHHVAPQASPAEIGHPHTDPAVMHEHTP